jgi:ABC-type Na+ efflux pump permease subunit
MNEIKEKIQKGWIYSKMWFDVLAATKEAAEESLRNHIEKLKKIENCLVVKEDFKETIEAEKPLPRIEKAYSKAAEIEILTKDIETLLSITIFFAPSAVEVLER